MIIQRGLSIPTDIGSSGREVARICCHFQLPRVQPCPIFPIQDGQEEMKGCLLGRELRCAVRPACVQPSALILPSRLIWVTVASICICRVATALSLQFASGPALCKRDRVLRRLPGRICPISPRPPFDKVRGWPMIREGLDRRYQTSADPRQSRGSLAVRAGVAKIDQTRTRHARESELWC